MPAQLTAPSSAYRRHTWLAVAGLLTFAGAYFALMGWFGWTAFRVFRTLLAGEGGDGLTNVIVGVFAAFLAVFMAKGLIFLKRGKASDDLELKPADQPELFAFLHRLADEAGAPRPKRVYLSPRVNAGVFYDLSLFNLVFPSQKNLDIGLALVNALNLGEFKAVLAHEFGHFAQRTMAVGRWVYVAHQIAAQLVARRDALDSLLAGLSRTDFRIAWVGWGLSLIVWAIRSLVELAFRVVVASERALSREMEYQADLVAASLAGSDALVHALHRLGAADDAWDRTIAFAAREFERGHAVDDLFAVQARMLVNLRRVSSDPLYAEPPPLPERDRESHRVFRSELVRTPQMWSTHPGNADRENNLKRRYVDAALDERSAMLLFRDADSLKRQLSHGMLRDTPPAFAPVTESLSRLDAEFDRLSMHHRYQGTYLGRSFVRGVNEPGDLFRPELDGLDDAQLRERIRALYAPAHGQALQQLRMLQQERATLDATRMGHLRASGNRVHWRGQTLDARKLGPTIAALDAEIEPLRQAVFTHDQECRSLHRIAARRRGGDWDAVLEAEVKLLHFCEHVEANLRDLHGVFINTLQVVTADKSVSKKEMRRLLNDAARLQDAMAFVYERADGVVADETVMTRVEQPLDKMLGHFTLLDPMQRNINDWLQRVDGWVNHTCYALGHLRSATLEALLANEDAAAARLESGRTATPAPAPSRVPPSYPVLLTGGERKLQTQLGWWDRFQTADGWVAGSVRAVVAAGIVVGVLVFGMQTGTATVSVYNGLAVPVRVDIDGTLVDLAPLQTTTVSVPAGEGHHVRTHTAAGQLIEAFDSDKITGQSQFTYNIAGAAPLVEWTATYGEVKGNAQRELGAPRWSATNAQYVLTTPPESIQTQSYENGGTRQVLSAAGDLAPQQQLGMVPDERERKALVLAHARWDAPDSRHLVMWLSMLADQPDVAPGVIAERIARHPDDIATLRMEQELSSGDAHRAVCARQQAMAARQPDSSAFAYLAVRCMDDGPEQDEAFLAGQRRWPREPWFGLGAGYVMASRGDWAAAESIWSTSAMAPQTVDAVAVELARVMRMRGADRTALNQLATQSAPLGNLLAIDSTQVVGSPYEAYLRVDRGEYEMALNMARADAALWPHILRLVAASDGAPRELIDQALAMPMESGTDPATAWMAWALALRHGRDDTQWRARLQASDPEDAARMIAFVDAAHDGAAPAQAEALLGNVPPMTRGIAYAAAAVVRGTSCPPQWRDGAKKLLFTTERPHLL